MQHKTMNKKGGINFPPFFWFLTEELLVAIADVFGDLASKRVKLF